MRTARQTRSWKDAAGVSAVEFALIAPLLIFCLFAIIDLGRFAMVADSLETAVARAARTAMVSSEASATPATIDSLSAQIRGAVAVPDQDALGIAIGWSGGSNTVGATVTITVTYPFDYFTPLLSSGMMERMVPGTITRTQSVPVVN